MSIITAVAIGFLLPFLILRIHILLMGCIYIGIIAMIIFFITEAIR